MNLAWFETIAHEKRIELSVQCLHTHPGRERQCVELARNSQSNAIAHPLEFQPLFVRPTAADRLAAHNRFGRSRAALESRRRASG